MDGYTDTQHTALLELIRLLTEQEEEGRKEKEEVEVEERARR